MEEVAGAEDGSKVITEDHLRDLSRNIKSLMPAESDSEHKDEDINSLRVLFEDVFYTSSKANLPATHRVAAWNVLCGLIDQCLSSDDGFVRQITWNGDLWDRCFELYLSQGHETRPKSAKQLLATLSSALKKAENRDDLSKGVAERLLSTISSTGDHGRTKSGLQALAFFMGRAVLSLDTVLGSLSSETYPQASTKADTALKDLLTLLLDCCGRDLGATIGQVLTAVLDRAKQKDADATSTNSPIWLEAFENSFDGDEVDWDELRTHIFPALFKRSLADYALFLNRHGLQGIVKRSPSNDTIDIDSKPGAPSQLLLAGLMSGKELGLLYETEGSSMYLDETSLFLPIRYSERLTYMSDRSTRLAGLSLLIMTRSATRPVPSETFKILKRRLSLFFADIDANFRGEVFSLLQKLMDRLRAATAVLARQSKTDAIALATLHEHEEFLKWLIRFLAWELRPTASYQRHISALKTLLVVVKSGVDGLVAKEYLSKSALNETRWPFSQSIVTKSLRSQLLDLLMNPFDDVRQTSATITSIYSACYRQDEKGAIRHELLATINQAEATMLVTGRADHADGVAHLYQLLFSLTNDSPTTSGPTRSLQQAVAAHLVDSVGRMLSTAKESLAVATNKYPLHGLLTSIRYSMLRDEAAYNFEDIVARLIEYLHTIWDVVKPVLCNDAPEGYVPEDADEMQSVTTKDTLSYCWRGLKDSSLLLGVLINSILLEQQQILALGNLCFVQLAELRHRGAFSTVAQTWAACCVRCKDMQIDAVPALQRWYADVLNSLRSRTTINTRRSAGLPSLICGLLVADKTGKPTSQAIHDLTEIARQPIDAGTAQESSLPQVHALNCIKDVLKNTRLSEHTERFVAHAFLLAAESLRSQAWAVRNCGLMLFRAAIDRLLGTSESHLEDGARNKQKISLSKQPEILVAIFDLLQPETDIKLGIVSGSEGVFPALQLLQRVQIPDAKHVDAVRAVEGLIFSRSWHVRDKAARTFATILKQEEVVLELERLLLNRRPDLNGQHGALLCMKYLVARLNPAAEVHSAKLSKRETTIENESSPSPTDGLLGVLVAARDIHFNSACPLIKAAFVDVLLAYHRLLESASCPERSQESVVDGLSVIDFSAELVQEIASPYCGPGESYLRRTLAQALAHQLPLSVDFDRETLISLILGLGRSDADACATLFEAVQRVPLSRPGHSSTAIHALVAVASQILEGDYDTGLKCEVQRFLLALASHEEFTSQSLELLQTFLHACDSATRPHNAKSKHIYADQWLQLDAVKCEKLAVVGLISARQSFRDVGGFVECCKLAVQQEQTSLFSREAAALAMQRAGSLWQYLSTVQAELLLNSCFVVYDLLNDDDEDIRQTAATIVSRILRTETNHNQNNIVYDPITAQQRLIRFMLRRWSNEPALAAEAIGRPFGLSPSGHSSTVKDRIEACSATDTALFVEEKQNLYVDEAREVKIWAQVLASLPGSAIPRQLLSRLAAWVSQGLDHLKDAIDSNKQSSQGWTSNPDAFVIGLQVVYSTEVLLSLVEKGVRIPVRPSDLRKKLGLVAFVGQSRSMDGLLMAEIERVLATSIASRLALQRRLLEGFRSRNT